jgi:uncharacterized metal-binding protein/predicted Fe-Mo cluster-binding NifX family protein
MMRFGIPLLAERVAPRCTFADSLLLVRVKRLRVQDRLRVPLGGTTWADLATVLGEHDVDALVCGGVSPSTRELIRSLEVEVIDNVAGTAGEVVEAIRRGKIHPGFGLRKSAEKGGGEGAPAREERTGVEVGRAEPGSPGERTGRLDPAIPRDCLECRNRVCLQGEPCPYLELPPPGDCLPETVRILESTWDVALEEERTLCRLAELVYFAMEMDYKRVGVAFCEDLREPAAILSGVLRRFFQVVPVGCRLGGGDPGSACDPSRVADYLNAKKTDLNVLVGFCVGADCVFNRESEAPVTTLFVKDKSLANNPIGAVYSRYYLTDI